MADPVTVVYNYTGGWQRFNVPAETRVLQVTIYGAGANGTSGGRVRGKVRVQGSDVVHILVGEHGRGGSGANGGGGTVGGGGPGGNAGSATRNGGTSGGGCTELRFNSQSGELIAIAGGAGGQSGDGGAGGAGGRNNGADGNRVGGGTNNVATGGTQTRGGNGGTIPSNTDYNGGNASDNISGRGGAGGHSSQDRCHGGGGGGGGYRAGGGGQGGKAGAFVGGGGGGGSSFVDPLFDVDLNDRSGTTGHGWVEITYDPDGDPNPITPTNLKINNRDVYDQMPLHASQAIIKSTVKDTVSGATWVTDNDVHEVVFMSPYGDPGGPFDDSRIVFRTVHHGNGVEATGGISSVNIGSLGANMLYRGRVYTQDRRGQWSPSYVSFSFWTNRPPNTPGLVSPANDTEFDSTDTIVFEWTYSDPDTEVGAPDNQAAYAVRYRLAATPKDQPGEWVQTNVAGGAVTHAVPAANLAPGRWYEWQAAVADSSGTWSPWSETRAFFINAIALPPTLVSPSNGEAIYAAENNVFEWRFNTMLADETQVTGDIRYKAVGAPEEDWQVINGDLDAPGSSPRWLIDAETFVTGTLYEWQARTHTSSSTLSVWSPSATFWAVVTPGAVVDIIPIDITRMQEALGQYANRVYVYARGGKRLIGEIAPIFDVQWDRKRDDIGSCTLHLTEWDPETRDMLRTLKPWAHELVVFRNGVRCWEGPITRISGSRSALEIEARDVMAYVYRRILRNGYNDSYQIVGGQQVGLHTVVYRAQRIITNALIYDDPNVLPYLTPIHNPGDAIQSRIVKAFTKTAWDEVDDLAAHAGLDYSVSGRRIILNDTHRPIGRLPELSDGDFSDPPIVTVYGMAFATDFGVTNNNGYYGLATRGRDSAGVLNEDTGFVEQLASEYGESDPTGAGTESMTPEEVAALQATLQAQAERNIAARYPMPVVVRVPDNSSLDPGVNLGINQLIPGVWAPLRATEGLVQASQWQKLDSITVRQDKDSEKIAVVFSPAPNGGLDPDADIEEV